MNTVQTAALWDALHVQPRFRPRYPNESVVRFLMGNFPKIAGRSAIDIGLGGGRHTRLLCELGFNVSGIDVSAEGVMRAHDDLAQIGYPATLRVSSYESLPFADESFDCAVSYGVFVYGTRAQMAQGIAEMCRVLKPGGRAFAMIRTPRDYRFGKGEEVEPSTFRLSITDTNEQGTLQYFPDESVIVELFKQFSNLHFERTEATFEDRTKINSDWLITCQK